MSSSIPTSSALSQGRIQCFERLNFTSKTSVSSSSTDSESSDLDGNSEESYDPANYMLNGLRSEMNTIHTFTRNALAKCETEESHKNTANDIESCTINLLRHEQIFLNTSSICCGILDDIAAWDADDEDDEHGGNHNWDKKVPLVPLLPELPPIETLVETREKMCQMLDERLKTFENSLTEEKLKQYPRFLALKQQIILGEEEFQKKYQRKLELDQLLKDVSDDDDAVQAVLLDASRERFLIDYGEELLDDDESVLPSIDPITKHPIMSPVRNSTCHHVFEKKSIKQFIKRNPETARCPLPGCRNTNVIKMEDFLVNDNLTKRVREKNSKLFQ